MASDYGYYDLFVAVTLSVWLMYVRFYAWVEGRLGGT